MLTASLIPTATQASTATHPRITLSRTSGPVGASITVTGTGFAHRRSVSVRFRDVVQGVVELAASPTNARGAFTTHVTIPSNPQGSHGIWAVDATGRRSEAIGFTIVARLRLGRTQVAPYSRICAQLGIEPKARYTVPFDLRGYPADTRVTIFLVPAGGGTPITARTATTGRRGSFSGTYVQPNVPSGSYLVRTSDPSGNFATTVGTFSSWYSCYTFSGRARPIRWRAEGVGFLPGTRVRMTWTGTSRNPILSLRVRANGTWGVRRFTTPCAPKPGRYVVRTIGTDGRGRPIAVQGAHRFRTRCG
jgi:hypothetical protein